MKVDMTSEAITRRMRKAAELARVCRLVAGKAAPKSRGWWYIVHSVLQIHSPRIVGQQEPTRTLIGSSRRLRAR